LKLNFAIGHSMVLKDWNMVTDRVGRAQLVLGSFSVF